MIMSNFLIRDTINSIKMIVVFENTKEFFRLAYELTQQRRNQKKYLNICRAYNLTLERFLNWDKRVGLYMKVSVGHWRLKCNLLTPRKFLKELTTNLTMTKHSNLTHFLKHLNHPQNL